MNSISSPLKGYLGVRIVLQIAVATLSAGQLESQLVKLEIYLHINVPSLPVACVNGRVNRTRGWYHALRAK